MTIQEFSEKIYVINSPYLGILDVLGTYLIDSEKNAIIDPGTSTQIPGVIKALKKNMVEKLDYILLTHIHLDHAGGLWKILEEYPAASVYLHPRGVPHMNDPSKLEAGARALFGKKIDQYGEIKGVDAKHLIESKDGEEIKLGNINLKVIWSSGHSSHHQVYFEPEERVLFVGDAAGKVYGANGGIIPTSPVPHNPFTAIKTVEKLIKLNPLVIAYSHFGFFKDAIQRLEEYKEQTLTWTKVIDECIEDDIGLTDTIKKLREVDINVEKILDAKLEVESNLFQSVEGFREYTKWMREKRK
jgi:glyoxylase-like metal-dependent hydrolase (beta-lactamase superfamily II)